MARGLAPRFLAHVHENGRVMGFLMEKMGRRPRLAWKIWVPCKAALRKSHPTGPARGCQPIWLSRHAGGDGARL